MPRALPPLLILAAANAQSEIARFDATNGTQALSAFGHSCCVAGDVNGDGVPDLVVGSPSNIGSLLGAGGVQVVSGADGRVIREHIGTTSRGLLGTDVCCLGDIDHDRISDYVISEPGHSASSGRVVAHSGASGRVLFQLVGRGFARLGHSIANVGDVNSDGFDDLGVIADEQRSAVHSGLDGRLLWSLSAAVGPRFAAQVAGAGDTNGDGVDDVVVGTPSANSLAGEAMVLSGTDGSVLRTFTGTQLFDLFGSTVDGADDVDGDGLDDVIVGGRSGATVFSGATGQVIHRVTTSTSEGVVAGLGDVDGDGFADFATSAPRLTNQGETWIFSGATGQQLRQISGPSVGAFSGKVVRPVEDFNGDRFPDVLITATGPILTGQNRGLVIVHSLDLTGNPAVVTRFGEGCRNRLGHRPRIHWTGSPRLGLDFAMQLTAAAPNTGAVLFVGARQQIDLASLGAPGCVLHADFNPLAILTTDAFGRAAIPDIPVPQDPALIGITLAAQWATADGRNALGLTLSDALEFCIGG